MACVPCMARPRPGAQSTTNDSEQEPDVGVSMEYMRGTPPPGPQHHARIPDGLVASCHLVKEVRPGPAELAWSGSAFVGILRMT